MTRATFVSRWTLAILLIALPLAARSADFVPASDGWHSWEVPAGTQGRRACCYRFRHGTVGAAGCQLDPRTEGWNFDTECDVESDTLRIFVQMKDGRVRELRALSAACPVESSAPINALGSRGTAESIAWLKAQAADNDDIADESLLAIAMHEDGAALAALRQLIEDRREDRELREQALFWLVQTGNDEAFRYLDQLLGQR